MPRSTYEGLTVSVMPAIAVEASDDGFIGFDAEATIAFSQPAVTLDSVKGGIVLDFDMDISVNEHATWTSYVFAFQLGGIHQPRSREQCASHSGFLPISRSIRPSKIDGYPSER
jgi:hypothetical protein